MCHAINLSQSDFTGNYLHVAIRGKTRRKQNSSLAKMTAKSDFMHKIIESRSTVGEVSLFKQSRNKECRDKIAEKARILHDIIRLNQQ